MVTPEAARVPLVLVAIVLDDADLDHFTPVLHKFVERHPQSPVHLIVANRTHSFRDDFRVRYLESVGVEVRHVLDSVGLSRRLQRVYFAFAGSRCRLLRRFATLWRLAKGRDRAFGTGWYAERFFVTEPGLSATVIVHNHHDSGFVALIGCARRAGVASVALPHAADNFDNWMNGVAKLDPLARRHGVVAPGDRIVASSRVARDRLVQEGRATADRVSVLGSARFCAEWQQVLARIVPRVTPSAPEGHFRILVLAAKPQSNLFEVEVLRIIETISRLPRVFVAVKLHPRTPLTARVHSPNVQYFDRDMASRALVEWADLTLFTATSNIVDSVVLDRPVLFLRRTANNRITAERYIQSWAVDCRDDLCEAIIRIQAGLQRRTYSTEERAVLIREMVEPAGPDVLNLYIDEIEAAVAVGARQLAARADSGELNRSGLSSGG